MILLQKFDRGDVKKKKLLLPIPEIFTPLPNYPHQSSTNMALKTSSSKLRRRSQVSIIESSASNSNLDNLRTYPPPRKTHPAITTNKVSQKKSITSTQWWKSVCRARKTSSLKIRLFGKRFRTSGKISAAPRIKISRKITTTFPMKNPSLYRHSKTPTGGFLLKSPLQKKLKNSLVFWTTKRSTHHWKILKSSIRSSLSSPRCNLWTIIPPVSLWQHRILSTTPITSQTQIIIAQTKILPNQS